MGTGVGNCRKFNKWGVGIIRLILIFVSLAWRYQLKSARCPLLSVMDFRLWFTFGAKFKFTSSIFCKIKKWGDLNKSGD